MERIRHWVGLSGPTGYSPVLTDTSHDPDPADNLQWASDDASEPATPINQKREHYNWEYTAFFILGLAMLWPWNMFIAAGTYFRSRFLDSPLISTYFNVAQLAVSTVVNLAGMIYLSGRQVGANYPFRIFASLVTCIIAFVLLTMSTKYFTDISATVYAGFVMLMVIVTSASSSLNQNGSFSYAGKLMCDEYIQAILAGQGFAGVLPNLAQFLYSSSAPVDSPVADGDLSHSAFLFFLTAVATGVIALLVFVPLYHMEGRAEAPGDVKIPSKELYTSGRVYVWIVFLTFCFSMFYPLFVQLVLPYDSSATYDPSVPLPLDDRFISGAILTWNIGDFLGRYLAGRPEISFLKMHHYPLLAFAILRILFVPLMFLCNLTTHNGLPFWPNGPVIPSWGYMLIQLAYGLSNGLISTLSFLGANVVTGPEREKAMSSFLATVLIAGLAAGSVASYILSTFLP